MTFNLFLDIGINKIIHLVIELKLIFCDKTHVEKPFFKVFIFGTNGYKFFLADRFALIVIVFGEFVLVYFSDFFVINVLIFQRVVVFYTYFSKTLKLFQCQSCFGLFLCDHSEKSLSELGNCHIAECMNCTNKLVFLNSITLIKVHKLKKLLDKGFA